MRPEGLVSPVNGDEVRSIRLPDQLWGYDACDVDELLDRIAAELDAGRPVASLAADAAFREVRLRFRRLSRAYETETVDWLLGQLRRSEHEQQRNLLADDPWRHLIAFRYSTGPPAVDARTEYADDWAAFEAQPGFRLRYGRAGSADDELRTTDGVPIATFRRRWRSTTVRVGWRTFTGARVHRAAWPALVPTFGAEQPRQPVYLRRYDGYERANGERRAVPMPGGARLLADESRQPVLLTAGAHIDRTAGAYMMLPGGRWLRFPVRATNPGNAIMTAVDQAGNMVARYRVNRGKRLRPAAWQVDITVHPREQLGEELILVLTVSADWLRAFFKASRDGGGLV
jgi:DivIVA domain-containing protein